VLGVSFISFLTAGVTSAVVRRSQDRGQEEQSEQMRQDTERIAASLSEIRIAIAELDSRLDGLS